MISNNAEMVVESTPETSFILKIPYTTDNTQQNSGVELSYFDKL